MEDRDRTGCPTLQHLCIQAVGEDDYWRVQKRYIEALPSGILDAIVEVITNRRCCPTSLFPFRETLTQLRIRTHIAKFIPMVPKLHSLTSLVLTNPIFCTLSESRVKSLAALAPSLLELKIWVARLPKSIGTVIGSLTSLKYLKIQSEMPDILGSLTDLRALEELHLASMTRPTGDLETSALSVLTSLKKLSLYDCDGLTDRAVRELNHLTGLEDLFLSGTEFHAPPCILSLTSLQLNEATLDLIEDDEILVWEDMNLSGYDLYYVEDIPPRSTNLGIPSMSEVRLEKLILGGNGYAACADKVLVQVAHVQTGLTSLHVQKGASIDGRTLKRALECLPNLQSLSFEPGVTSNRLHDAIKMAASRPGLEVSIIEPGDTTGVFRGQDIPPLLNTGMDTPPYCTPLRRELLKYDQRYKYTAEELLALRVAGGCAVGGSDGGSGATRLCGVPSDLLAAAFEESNAIMQ